MIWIGIDPGAKGAMAVIQENDVAVIPFDKGKYVRYLTDIKQNHPHVCCIEQVHALHGNGVTSSFNFGTTYGWLLGMLDAIGISYQPIMPQRWKKEFGLTSDKAQSVEVCKRLYPDVDLKRTERSKKDDDGMAEALLMATYAKRKF